MGLLRQRIFNDEKEQQEQQPINNKIPIVQTEPTNTLFEPIGNPISKSVARSKIKIEQFFSK